MSIEGIMGIDEDQTGNITQQAVRPGFENTRLALYGLRTARGVFDVENGSVTSQHADAP